MELKFEYDAPNDRWIEIMDSGIGDNATPKEFDLAHEFDRLVEEGGIDKEKVCECGKDKHGFANHSDWCPKYENA